MTSFGYTLSSEEWGPRDLVEAARRAEEVGFDFCSISDHFHPWSRSGSRSSASGCGAWVEPKRPESAVLAASSRG